MDMYEECRILAPWIKKMHVIEGQPVFNQLPRPCLTFYVQGAIRCYVGWVFSNAAHVAQSNIIQGLHGTLLFSSNNKFIVFGRWVCLPLRCAAAGREYLSYNQYTGRCYLFLSVRESLSRTWNSELQLPSSTRLDLHEGIDQKVQKGQLETSPFHWPEICTELTLERSIHWYQRFIDINNSDAIASKTLRKTSMTWCRKFWFIHVFVQSLKIAMPGIPSLKAWTIPTL